MRIVLFALATATICSGCAFTPQAVQVKPEVRLNNATAAAGQVVNVAVVDERPSKNLGQRGAHNVGADLTVQAELSEIVGSAIKEGLEKEGFKPSAQGDEPSAKLKVEVRSLEYKVISGFWSGTIRSECAMKALCKSSSGAEYEKFYSGVFEKSIQVIATEKENDAYVSASVSDAVNKLLNDRDLGRCLAQ